MERDLLSTSTDSTKCQLMHSRALCAVCGAPAIGRNFDAMTCLSCKAFFRRNAYNDHLAFTCRLTSSCEINSSTRRHCSACRLKKCFQRGMKKELIRSLTAINHATSAAMTNLSQRLSTRSTTMNFLPTNDRHSLTLNDWTLLTNIRNAYEQYCVQKFLQSHETIPLIPPLQPYRSRIKIQRLLDLYRKYTVILASFLQRILQFDIFHYPSDRHYLYMRKNFSCLLAINTSELMKSKVLEHFPWENDQLAVESFLSEKILRDIQKVIQTFQTLLPYDAVIMKLFLIVLAFSSRVSPLLVKNQYDSTDFQPLTINLYDSQNYYLTLLWKYVVYRLGYENAVTFFVRFIQNFLHRQQIEADIVEIVQNRNDYSQILQYKQKNFQF